MLSRSGNKLTHRDLSPHCRGVDARPMPGINDKLGLRRWGKPIWSAQSETLDPRSAEKLMDLLISVVIKDLRKKRLLKAPSR